MLIGEDHYLEDGQDKGGCLKQMLIMVKYLNKQKGNVQIGRGEGTSTMEVPLEGVM